MSIAIREAEQADLEAVVDMLADDALGAQREQNQRPLPEAYLRAFRAIRDQPGQTLLVAHEGTRVIGCVQLSFLPGLSHQGMMRAQIEGVRVASEARGRGIGGLMIEDCIRRAREAGCGMIQLTSDRSREDAQRFYARLGFQPTHVGMKLKL